MVQMITIHDHHPRGRPAFPHLSPYNRTQAATDFTKQFRSLATKTTLPKSHYK
ncbi:hypothetical protein RchiOBHm_Chr5g0054411 [Rosa chinensis]|uniref:Uncharacterized protein n=1 Tax=Rosa chinensis TaxID=74649 RepID=A0A2P6QG62_ROSCH|nr:hypothetical protein RchiOBHm_Chr5g0054411 [Rosa chinensis]